MYINLISIDGGGKDTVYESIIQEYPEAIRHREPGGTPEAERIRDILLSPSLSIKGRIDEVRTLLSDATCTEKAKYLLTLAKQEMSANGLTGLAEIYLYAASRAQSNDTLIRPAKTEGKLILGRRSVACSMSYQGYARGYGMDLVWSINEPVMKGCYPDLEILLDLPVEVAQKRLQQRTEKQDRMDQESLDFHQKTRDGYLQYYVNYCPYRYVVVDGAQSKEHVLEDVRRVIQHALQKGAISNDII